MKHGRLISLLIALTLTGAARAQAPWQFRWEKGVKLDYKVEHLTQVAEVVDGKKVESKSRLNLVKRWSVLEVDAKGVATVELTLVALRNEQARPGGETLFFDSQNLDKSTPELREAMSKFVGKTVSVLQVNPFGQVVGVKEGSATKYEMEPPFVLVLPSVAPKEGQAWQRTYQITLEPPLGTGEKFDASQRFQCDKIEGKHARLGLITEVPKMPMSAQEQIPLLQKLAQGHVVFDFAAGRLHSVSLGIDRMIENHEGAGSSYRFLSTYTEQLAE